VPVILLYPYSVGSNCTSVTDLDMCASCSLPFLWSTLIIGHYRRP